MMVLAVFGQDSGGMEKARRLIAPELTDEQFRTILEQGQKFSSADFIKIIRLFIRAENEIKFSALPQLPLELAVVELIGE
jgi:hypothetical protein